MLHYSPIDRLVQAETLIVRLILKRGTANPIHYNKVLKTIIPF